MVFSIGISHGPHTTSTLFSWRPFFSADSRQTDSFQENTDRTSEEICSLCPSRPRAHWRFDLISVFNSPVLFNFPIWRNEFCTLSPKLLLSLQSFLIVKYSCLLPLVANFWPAAGRHADSSHKLLFSSLMTRWVELAAELSELQRADVVKATGELNEGYSSWTRLQLCRDVQKCPSSLEFSCHSFEYE